MTPNSRRPGDREPHALNPLARAPYALAGQLAALVAAVVPEGGGKIARSFAARRGATARLTEWARRGRDPSRPLLWMHAPSVGEGLMARPVIERIHAARPEVQLAWTFFSPSAESFAESLPVDIAGYLPFDTRGAARELLDALRPSALVFSKLDVWPILAEAAAERGIPSALISASLAPDSGRRSTVARLLLSDAYASLAAVGAVHEDDALRLRELGLRADRMAITGATRYDKVSERAPNPERPEVVSGLRSARPTLVAGSTWPADDRHLMVAFGIIRRRVPNLRVILAPHEPGARAFDQWVRAAGDAGTSIATIDHALPETDIVWVDAMGILADLYALADVAFVGGGFHAKGLHSVIEPAAHGVPVLFGPAHGASRDALTLLAAGGAFAVHSGEDLSGRISALLGDTAALMRAGKRARSVVTAGLGAAARSATLVESLLAR